MKSATYTLTDNFDQQFSIEKNELSIYINHHYTARKTKCRINKLPQDKTIDLYGR